MNSENSNENGNKSIEVTEIEEKKLDLPLLLNTSPPTQSPLKPILQDKITTMFHSSLSQIQETLLICEEISKRTVSVNDMEIINNLNKTLNVLQRQYLMIEEIYPLTVSCEYNPEDLQKIIQKYQDLKEFMINILKIEDFCLPMLLKIDPFFLEMLKKFQKKLGKLNKNWNSSKRKFYFNFLYIYETKFQYIAEFLPYIVIYPNDDLLIKDRTHKDWLEILPYYEESPLVSELEMNRQLKKFADMLNASSAVYYDNFLRKSNCCKGLKMAKDAIYYFFCSKKAKNKAHLFYSNPDVRTAISIWSIPDKTFVKRFMTLGYPCIKTMKKIYLERTVPSFTLETILEEYGNGLINKINEKQQIPHENLACNRTLRSLYRRGGRDQIKVRVLSSIKLNSSMNSQAITSTLLIHIHGGGFISMSSHSHQCYTRIFAKMTRTPVFSIDYRLSPDAPYPMGFDDVWQAYNWLVNNSLKYFGVEPKNIILTGDSAGGNLAAAITIACIKKGFRRPDGLFLMYPALNTSKEGFTPSYMKAFTDVVLQHTFLKICLNSYVTDPRLKPDLDPYLSPRKAADDILMEFPPVRIVSGGRDPLSDDSLKFLQKMVQLKKDIKMKTYNGLPHGFMNYDYIGGLSPAKIAIQDSCRLLAEFVKEIQGNKEL